MRGARLLLILSTVASCPGCVVVSLHPLWSPDVHAEDQFLEGEWVKFDRVFGRDGAPWVVTAQRGGAYEIQIRGDRPETTVTYSAVLARIGDRLYLDIQPKPGSSHTALASIATHQFLRLTKGEDRLRIEAIDRKKFEAAVKKAGGPIRGEEVDIKLVLTAKTPALQAFFKEHGDEVFGEPTILRRRPAAEQAAEAEAPTRPPKPALRRTPVARNIGQAEPAVDGSAALSR
jgi:hypothetical protein